MGGTPVGVWKKKSILSGLIGSLKGAKIEVIVRGGLMEGIIYRNIFGQKCANS